MKIADLIKELGVAEDEGLSLIQACGIEANSLDDDLDDDLVDQVKEMVSASLSEPEKASDQETSADVISEEEARESNEEAVDGTMKKMNPTLADLADNLGMGIDELMFGVQKVGLKIDDPLRELTSEEGKLILDSLHIIESELAGQSFAEVAQPDIVEVEPEQEKASEEVVEEDESIIRRKQDEKEISLERHAAMKQEEDLSYEVRGSSEAGGEELVVNAGGRMAIPNVAARFSMSPDEFIEKAQMAGVSISDPTKELSAEEAQAIEEFIEREALIAEMQRQEVEEPEPTPEPEPKLEPEPEPEPEPTPAGVVDFTDEIEAEIAAETQEAVVEEEPVQEERAAVDMITEIEEEKPKSSVFKNPFVWLTVGVLLFVFIFAGATFIFFKGTIKSEKPAMRIVEQVVLTEESATLATEGDIALLRLIWRMDSDGFYKSAYEMCLRFEKEYPNSGLLEDVMFKKADILYKWEKYPPSKQYKPAIESADQVARKYPQSNKAPWALFLKGNSYSKLKLYEDALDAYREIVKAYPLYARLDEVQFAIAESYFNKGKHDVAEKEYLRVVSRFPESDLKNNVYYKIGVCLDKQNRFEDAISAYRRFLKMYPEDLNKDEAQLALANIYFRTGDYAQAKQAFRKTIGRYPYDTYNDRALFMMAECLSKEKDYKGARKILDELIYNYRDSDYAAKAIFKMGDYYFEAKNMRQAIKYYETAIEKYPKHELVRPTVIMLGNIYLENKEFEKAIAFYRDRLTRYPDVATDDKLYLLLGKAYYEKGIYIAAVNAFDKVNSLVETAKLLPEQLQEVHYLKAEAYYSAELYSESKDAYMRLLNKYPESDKADYFYFRLGMSSYNLMQYSESIDNFQVGMEKYPLSKYRYQSRLVIARAYRELERVEKAVENFERIVNNEYLRGREVYYEACFDLADVYNEQEAYQRALSLLDEIINGNVSEEKFFRSVRQKGVVLAAMGSVDKMIRSYEDVIKVLLAQEVFTEEQQRLRLERITDFYTDIGDILFKEKRYQESLDSYQKAYKTMADHPKTDWIVYQIGNSYNEMDDYKQANIYYELLQEEYADSYWSRQLGWNLKRMELKKEML